MDTPWHAMTPEDAVRQTRSSPEGLDDESVAHRLNDVGPNTLKTEEGTSPIQLLWQQINSPLIYLLMAAGTVSLIAEKTVDAIVIAGVVTLNTVLGFIQEWRAEGALAALRKMSAPEARVLRGGHERDIAAGDVVPGDVLILETGARVAADARILSGDELQADESALTGESEPTEKSFDRLEENTPIGDRSNMVWMSTSITSGRGRAVVVETGMQTQIGRIAGEIRSTVREATPLQKRMHRLGMMLGGAGLGLAALVFVLGLLRGYGLVEMLLFAVAVAVSAIPEGLPAVITVTLALGVRRMAGRHAIVKRLPAVETLGSTTVICSDKTGTITRNQMTVRRLWADGRVFNVTGEGYAPEGEIREANEDGKEEYPEALTRLLRIGALANNARVTRREGRWQADGNPSGAALLTAAGKAGLDPDALREQVGRLDEVPFSSDRKYMATLHARIEGEEGAVALVKGAPDRLFEFCSHILIGGERIELTENRREELRGVNERLAGEALRVMAGAYRNFSADKYELETSDVESGLTLAGLWGMLDPPREQSAPAVKEAKEAGIRPVLITGDYAATAIAIARKVGITEGDRALSPADVEEMESGELAEATLEAGVFARVSPAHKLKIMEALKQHGEIVAMTGDGVNDAPALKGADIGVAMGRAGTAVAREAADMVLTDDNFATIVDAVEEGRTIFANLRHVVFFLLATNLGEILTLIGALLIGLELPLTAAMVLWVNLVTDGACTIPLGVEPRHSDVLKQPPRDPRDPIVDRTMLLRMAILTPLMAVGTLGLFWFYHSGNNLALARTAAFTTLAAFQWFQAFNARSRTQSLFEIGPCSNRWLLLGLAVAVAAQVLTVQSPLGGWLFGTVPLGTIDWLWIMLVSSTIWIADELLKRFGITGFRVP